MEKIMQIRYVLAIVFAGALGAHSVVSQGEAMPAFASAVIANSEAQTEEFEWGTLTSYFSDQTFGTRDVLAAVAVINPGMQIHPPHEHAEEEFLMVLEGAGEWHLLGKDFPAKQGDMLYASPWDSHGIRNSGNVPLKFVVWKWNNKGLPLPERPAAE
jgi:mannose-6-phosphate isomerase-like protein (cupin superfamily)